MLSALSFQAVVQTSTTALVSSLPVAVLANATRKNKLQPGAENEQPPQNRSMGSLSPDDAKRCSRKPLRGGWGARSWFAGQIPHASQALHAWIRTCTCWAKPWDLMHKAMLLGSWGSPRIRNLINTATSHPLPRFWTYWEPGGLDDMAPWAGFSWAPRHQSWT